MREKFILAKASEDYKAAFEVNHVKRVWEDEEEYQRRYQEWLGAEQRAMIEHELLEGSLRYGWEAERRDDEGEEMEGGYWVYVSRLAPHNGGVIENDIDTPATEFRETVEKPIYSYEEYVAMNDILRIVRSFMAKRWTRTIRPMHDL